MLRSPPWLGWPLWNICVTNDHGYVPLVVSTSRSFPHSRLITGFITRLTRWVPLVKQELPILTEHLSSPPVFSGIHVTRSLILYVCVVCRCLFVCAISFGHCVVCSHSICGFWLPLWYLQTLPTQYIILIRNSNNVIPSISSKPNVTNKKTITDDSNTWQETLQTNWLTVGIIHYSNDNWSVFHSSTADNIFTGCLIANRNCFPSRAPEITNVYLVVSCCHSFLFFCIMSCAQCCRYLWIVTFWLSFRFSLTFIFSRIPTLEFINCKVTIWLCKLSFTFHIWKQLIYNCTYRRFWLCTALIWRKDRMH